MSSNALHGSVGLWPWLWLSLVLAAHAVRAAPVQFPAQYRVGQPLLSQYVASSALPPSGVCRLSLSFNPPSADASDAGDPLIGVSPDAPSIYFCDPRKSYQNAGRTVVVAPTASTWNVLSTNPAYLLSATGSRTGVVFFGFGGIAICGTLGLQYSVNASAAIALTRPAAEGHVLATIAVEVLVESDGYSSPVSTPDNQTVGVFAGTPTTAEVAAGSVWCGGAADGGAFVSPRSMLTAASGSVLPPLFLALFDSWGNPATLSADATFGPITISPEPQGSGDALLVGSGQAVAAAGTHVVVVTGLMLNASATLQYALSEPASTSVSDVAVVLNGDASGSSSAVPYYYALNVVMEGLQLGGQTAKCRRFTLTPGAPHSLTVEPLSDYAVTHDASYRTGYIVPKTETLYVAVTVRDAFGNLLPPGKECGLAQPTVSSFLSGYCIDCTATGSMSVDSRVSPVAASGVNTTAAFFRMSSPALGWTQLTCSVNTTQALYALVNTAPLQVVSHGEFDCYSGNEPFSQLVDAKGLADIHAVFFDPSLRTPPMAKVELYIPFTSTPMLLPDVYAALGELTNAGPRFGYQDLDADLFHWVVIPRRGFVYIPLGLLSVMSFGASYTTVSSAVINVTKPVCSDAAPNQIRNAVSQWLYSVGDNSTAWYRRNAPSTDPTLAVSINIQVCYGTGISQLEFVSMYCCDRYSVCESAASQSPLGMILLSGGLFVSLGVSAATCWFLWRTVNRVPVQVKPKQQLDIAEKTRVVLAHAYAPVILWFHAYFIFTLEGVSARLLFWGDVVIAILWYVVSALRCAFPLVVTVPSVYRAAVTVVLYYSQFLMCNCAIWTLTALHLNTDLLPYLVASSLAALQVFWSVQAAEAQLQPSILQEKVPQFSMVPVDAVLSLEYFVIAIMLLFFALTQQTELSSLGAFGATAIVVAFSWFWNYSIAVIFNDAVQRAFGKDATTATVMEKVTQHVKGQQVQSAVARADGAARELGVALTDLGAPLLRSTSPHASEDAGGTGPEAGREMTTVGKVIERWKEASRRGSQAANTALLSPEGRSLASPIASFRRLPHQVQSLIATASGESSPAEGPLRPQRRTQSQFSSADGTDGETTVAREQTASQSETPSRSPTSRPSAAPAASEDAGQREEFITARLIARLAQSNMI